MKYLLAFIAVVLSTTGSIGQLITYGVDVSTDFSEAPEPDSLQRLFLNETTPAPVGTTLWFVADVSGNGFPSGQVTDAEIFSIFAGTGEVRLFSSAMVDGTLPFDQAGKFKGVINVPISYASASIGLLLWNDANQDGLIGNAGDSFGSYDFGIISPATVGNAEVFINQDVYAHQNLVTPVPEPAQVGAVFGALALFGALMRRRFAQHK